MAAGVSRNLRAKTVQASMVTRAKALGAINNHNESNIPPANASSNERIAKAITRQQPSAGSDEKENTDPYLHSQPSLTVKPDWDDLDAEDAGDPLMVSEYVVEIIKYMRSIEVCTVIVD